ncbi:MAG: hypothetical protein JNG85_17840 [Spirochaetaceae bacterium]|nr:hypothetical protein [Spirochaetaceae bacterium]
MKLDIAKVPWSRRGSRLALARGAGGGLVLKDVGGGDEIPNELFDLELLRPDGAAVTGSETSVDAEPTRCAISVGGAMVALEFAGARRLKVACRGGGLRLTMRKGRYDHVDDLGEGLWEIQCYAKDRKYRLETTGASVVLDAPWAKVGNERIVVEIRSGEAFLEECAVLPERPSARSAARNDALCAGGGAPFAEGAEESFGAWMAGLPAAGPELEPARDLAAYITWSCLVAPEGRLTREGMYMSKNWMTNVWSWDNCFNGLAAAGRFPGLALDQLLLMADNQHESGAYPDYVNDKFASFSCLKPPIHAWALRGILERARIGAAGSGGCSPGAMPPPAEAKAAAYASISRSTRFWLEGMRLPGGALVYKHGNDSGWDNASIFAEGGPVESPDLYAHLARQCDELACLARVLGLPEAEARAWEGVAEGLVAAMLERLWDGKGFFARKGPSGTPIARRDSLILRLPVVAGKRLPTEIARSLVGDLADQGRFLAPYGPATEALDSKFFRRDGYWLGPVWAPTTYLVVDALRALGETGLARETARRFLAACAKGGMAENFDPLSGDGLVDPAFTWTSSVFLLLLEEYPELAEL